MAQSDRSYAKARNEDLNDIFIRFLHINHKKYADGLEKLHIIDYIYMQKKHETA